jgi:hypothetical protein
MARRKLAPNWKDLFLEALRNGHTITYAARHAGVQRRTAYKHREKSPKFAEAWNDALQEGLDNLLEECYRRALDSTYKASAQLLMFLVRCRLQALENMPDEDIMFVD